jgi:hypothetical protein
VNITEELKPKAAAELRQYLRKSLLEISNKPTSQNPGICAHIGTSIRDILYSI